VEIQEKSFTKRTAALVRFL